MSTSSLDPQGLTGLIRASHAIVALTGAGISTAAGIPDFRGPQGLYVTRRYDPEKVFEIGWFRREPRWFYEFSTDFVALTKEIAPTFTHQFLADLERTSRLSGVITQNIDGLHSLAGSENVMELHGSYRTATCQACRGTFRDLSYGWWSRAMTVGSDPPIVHCISCKGVLKPDIVFFGEPVVTYEPALDLVRRCDLLIILGSSLNVTPASLLPYHTTAPTVIVNLGDVMLPPAANRFFVNDELDRYFREVAAARDW